MHQLPHLFRRKSCKPTKRTRGATGFTLVEVMVTAGVLVMAALPILWILIDSYRLVTYTRYRDNARAVLQTYVDQFLRLQTSDTQGSTMTRPYFTRVDPPGTGVGLLWDNNATPGLNLTSLSNETGFQTPATSGTYLPVIIGGTQTTAGGLPANGIPAQITRVVQGVDANGNLVPVASPFTAVSAGEMLLGTFTITYTVNNQQITQSLSVLRAAP
jgi:type II secretory pathway pseudopilin PulG